jgi:hypothetical protein
MFKSILFASGLALASSGALAIDGPSWIDGLYNTGSGFSAGEADTHYTFERIEGTATGTHGHGVVSSGTGFPFSSAALPRNIWVANDETSQWLAPTAATGTTYDRTSEGLYKWSLSFDLTGLNVDTASFTARWLADNDGYISLNGNTIATGANYLSWMDFSADSGFVAGINTLDFYVTNFAGKSGNPTGLRVEFLSSYAVGPTPVVSVPEPTTSAMILAGLFVVGAVARRRMG